MIIPMRAGCMVAYSIIMWMSLARAGGGVLTLVVLVSVLVGLGLKPSCTGLSINPCRRAGVPSITMNSASPGRLLPFSGVDITPKVHARFGNIFTDFGAEVEVRFGRLNAMPYQSANYGFIRADVKEVGYNATIEGAYFSDDTHKVHAKKQGGEVEVGYLWQGSEYAFSASIFRRANEMKEMSNATGNQNIVRLQFIYPM